MSIPFYVFDFNNVIVSVFLSMLSCIIAIESSRKINMTAKKAPYLLIFSTLLGTTFWLAHSYVSFSINLNFSTENYFSYFSLNLLLCVIGSYIALRIAQNNNFNQKRYIITGLGIGLIIIVADITGFYILFRQLIEFKPILLIMSSLLTFGTALSMLRFLIQITNEELFTFETKWKYIGCFLAGSSLAGIPYIVLVSILDLSSLDVDNNEPYLFLVPFIYMINANLVLLLGPDFFGARILSKVTSRYKSLSNQNPNAVFSINLEGKIVGVNKEALLLTGYSEGELIGLHISTLLYNGMSPKLKMILNSVRLGDAKNIETKLKRKDGGLLDVKITASRIIIDKVVVGAFGIVEDITQFKLDQATIEHLAYYDELTNLPNRRKLKEMMLEKINTNKPFSLFLIDFDKFKRINDNFGHTFGDCFLVAVSERLSHTIPMGCSVSRMGGDEFVVIVPNIYDPIELAEKILNEFRIPIIVNGVEILLTASLGITSYPLHSDKEDELVKYADISMYKAKEYGSNGYTYFNTNMIDEQINLSLENDLRKAIDDNILEIYYQPKYNLNNRNIIGSEALLRWNHPEKGFIPPSIFVPLAEEVGLIVKIERYVIEEVCRTLMHWKETKINTMRISINVSLISLFQEDFIEFINNTFEKFDIDGSLIEFEITERMVMKNEKYVNDCLQILRDKGIEISIDDFGTGYSSLSYLHKLNVDRLKIDKSFIDISNQRTEIISTIINVANGLNLKVIAEGVETEEQVELLRSLGCNEVQGFFYSKPIPAEEYKTLLQTLY